MARSGRAGVLIGLIPRLDLPVTSHDPQRSLLGDGSVLGHADWNVPSSLSVTASGDMLAVGLAEEGAVDDSAALYDLASFLGQALRNTDGWPARRLPELPWNRQTILWLLGIVLPIAFLGVGTWSLLAASLTNLRNAKRALSVTDARVVTYLQRLRRVDRRTRRKIRRAGSRLNRRTQRVERLKRAGTDVVSVRNTARKRKAEGRMKSARTALRDLEEKRDNAAEEVTAARKLALQFADDRRHARDSDPGPPDVRRVVRNTRPRRLWLWLTLRADPYPFRGLVASRGFLAKKNEVAACLVCWRSYYEWELDSRKEEGKDIVAGVWNGVWKAMTSREGLVAFAAGAASVIAAVVLSGILQDPVGSETDPSSPTPLRLVLLVALVVGVYRSFGRSKRQSAVVWGATVFTMLGLTTIEFTALSAALKDVFDSQRVTIMELAIVAMLFMGQAFGNRAGNGGGEGEVRGRKGKVPEDEHLAETALAKCLDEVPDRPYSPFGECVASGAGAPFRAPDARERHAARCATLLYLAICAHFVATALEWKGYRPTGVGVEGAALDIVIITGTVVLLPVFSLWKEVARKQDRLQETEGEDDAYA